MPRRIVQAGDGTLLILSAEVASGGHMSPITNPDAVNAEIERFLLAQR